MRATLTAVVPLRDGARTIERAVEALARAREQGRLDAILVVDDGSRDEGPELARAAGARVIALPERAGPGAARNLGLRAAGSELVLFADADVVVHDDVAGRIAEAFERDAHLVGLFGSYDDAPPAPGLVSRYRNLWHHHVHQRSPGPASTFWAGCGAVRREAFLAAGGFDEERYPHASIEDIELGLRLAEQGLVRLDPRILCTHLKRWTLASMIRTDALRRALPWSRLLLSDPRAQRCLNVTSGERAKAVLGATLLASPLLLLAAPRLALLVVMPALLLAAVLVNAPFFRLVARVGGARTVPATILLHQLHYLVALTGFAYCRLEAGLRRRTPIASGETRREPSA